MAQAPNIHPTAIIHPNARVHPSVQIGPYSIIEGDVQVGANTEIGAQVHLLGNTTIGEDNRIHTGCVLGDTPQDIKYQGEDTCLIIGDGNHIREHVTIHRSNSLDEDTTLGNGNFLMANSHIGHNSVIGNQNTLANGALIGGHVILADRAFISGNCMIHQFVRIGSYALMQGGTGITKDLPPFTIAHSINQISGLNTVGLRRAGFAPDIRTELKKAYHLLFRNKSGKTEAIRQARLQCPSSEATMLIDFVAESTRGVCADKGR